MAAPAPLTMHKYETRIGAIPPSPPHPWLGCSPSPPKRARTSSLGESSHLQAHEPPQSPPPPAPPTDNSQVHSLRSMIRRPLFHCGLIAENSNYSGKDLHNEHFYDLSAFAALLELRDSMRLVQRYHLEPFMTQRQFLYPRVVVEFYQIMTSRRDLNPIALHFSINGHERIL